MALNVLGNYFAKKSIKLSDAYAVYIKKGKSIIEYTDCVGFTVPKFEQDEDVITYGNVSQTFLIPKYDTVKEFTLTFYESLVRPSGVLKNKFEQFFNENTTYQLMQKFDNNGLSQNYGVYNSNVIPSITIKVANNVLHKFVYKYEFINCKIVNYNLYNLDYQTDSPCQITFNFTFDSYEKQNINETISYNNLKQQTQQSNEQPKAPVVELEALQSTKVNEQELTVSLERESNREQALKDLSELDSMDSEIMEAANQYEYEQKNQALEQTQINQSRQPDLGKQIVYELFKEWERQSKADRQKRNHK